MWINATLCYLRKDGNTLMMHRNRKPGDIHKGKWNGLGGKIEPGESPLDCAVREVKEESGLIVRSLTLKGILTFPAFDGKNDWQVFLFLCEHFEGNLQPCAEGDLDWIPNEKLLDLPLWEGDRTFIPWLDLPGLRWGWFAYRDGKLEIKSWAAEPKYC